MPTPGEGGTATVFLVDDFGAARAALRDSLGRHPSIEVVGTAESIERALDGIRSSRPEVAVIDDRLPDGRGLDLCEILARIDPGVVSILHAGILSPTIYGDARRAGASAVILKQIDTAQLVSAILRLTAPRRAS
jgi:DNA-binding NarL/FixJ family response regulator